MLDQFAHGSLAIDVQEPIAKRRRSCRTVASAFAVTLALGLVGKKTFRSMVQSAMIR